VDVHEAHHGKILQDPASSSVIRNTKPVANPGAEGALLAAQAAGAHHENLEAAHVLVLLLRKLRVIAAWQ